jgi:hypothetical protein
MGQHFIEHIGNKRNHSLRPTLDMKNRSCFLGSALAFTLAAVASATTVIPPSFDELVNEAEVIFQGTVTNVRSQWIGEGVQRHIVSYVTFKVQDALKGDPGKETTLRMFGGTIDGQTMQASDAPTFKVGDRDVLFVEHNGTQFIPLVGIMHGRYRVKKDESGHDIILTNKGMPLNSLDQVGKESVTPGPAMTAEQFKQAVQARTGQRSRQP